MSVADDSDRARMNQAPLSESSFLVSYQPPGLLLLSEFEVAWALSSHLTFWEDPPVLTGFCPISHCTSVLSMGTFVNFHICHLVSHHHCTSKTGYGSRLAGDNTEELAEEMETYPIKSGQRAF